MEIIENLKKKYPIKLITSKNKKGYSKAMLDGIRYSNADFLLIMDSDGEDKPDDIVRLLDECKINENKIVFARRKKRRESVLFRALHFTYKKIFKILIGKDLDFGNFSCMTKANLNKIVNINNLQTHYSASILRSKIPFNKIDCEKGFRIEGSSKLNFWKHFAHALMSLSVFVDLIAIKFFLMTKYQYLI